MLCAFFCLWPAVCMWLSVFFMWLSVCMWLVWMWMSVRMWLVCIWMSVRFLFVYECLCVCGSGFFVCVCLCACGLCVCVFLCVFFCIWPSACMYEAISVYECVNASVHHSIAITRFQGKNAGITKLIRGIDLHRETVEVRRLKKVFQTRQLKTNQIKWDSDSSLHLTADNRSK